MNDNNANNIPGSSKLNPAPTSSAIKVLLVEDNEADIAIASHYLGSSSMGTFSVTSVTRLEDSLHQLKQNRFDIVVLDLHLPDSHGLDTLKRIVEATPRTPIVVVTGTADDRLGIEAVRLGAEDFLPKADMNAELLIRSLLFARERSAHKKSDAAVGTKSLHSPHLEIDLEKQSATVLGETGKEVLPLTPIEFRILVFLFRNQGQTVGRGQIVAEIWGDDSSQISYRNVDKHISGLKKKAAAMDKIIGSVYGVGYRFEDLT